MTMNDMTKWLAIVGLLLTLIGAGLGVRGVYLSPDQAIQIGVSRFNGNNREEDLRLPAVQNLITQSRYAMFGFALIGVGTVLQIVAVWMSKQ